MTRRTKLSREQKAKRAVKRVARSERARRRRARRTGAMERVRSAMVAYVAAATRPPRESSVVCLSCFTEQRYVDAPGNGVQPCRREELLGLPCDGEICVTREAWGEAA